MPNSGSPMRSPPRLPFAEPTGRKRPLFAPFRQAVSVRWSAAPGSPALTLRRSPVPGLDAETENFGEHQHHRMGSLRRRRFQPLQPRSGAGSSRASPAMSSDEADRYITPGGLHDAGPQELHAADRVASWTVTRSDGGG